MDLGGNGCGIFLLFFDKVRSFIHKTGSHNIVKAVD